MITNPQEFKDKLLEIQNNTNIALVYLPSDEPRFIIDANSRAITIPGEFGFLSLKKDHNAETIYFEIDRYFDGEDLSQHTCVVQYKRSDKEGVYAVKSYDIESVDGKIIFGWTITNEVTLTSGDIEFSVRFYSIKDNKYVYNFNTLPAKSKILETLDIGSYPYEDIPAADYEIYIEKVNALEDTIITKADMQNEAGGFAGGENATATSGGAVGLGAFSDGGGAVGKSADTQNGGAVGYGAHTHKGGAVGAGARALNGGSVGLGALTSNGFAGGQYAITYDENGDFIDAVQLGTGTNPNEKTLQVYDYQLMDASGNVPKERIANAVADIVNSLVSISGDYVIEPVIDDITEKFTLKASWVMMAYSMVTFSETSDLNISYNNMTYCLYAGETPLTASPLGVGESTRSASGAFEGNNITIRFYLGETEVFRAKLNTINIFGKKLGRLERI